MKLPNALRITSDGTPAGTKLLLGDKEVPYVTQIQWSITTDGLATATVVVCPIELDASADDGELISTPPIKQRLSWRNRRRLRKQLRKAYSS